MQARVSSLWLSKLGSAVGVGAVVSTVLLVFAFASRPVIAEEIPPELTQVISKNQPGKTPNSVTIKVGERATFSPDPAFVAA